MLTEGSSFRGATVRSPFQNSLPWGSISVSARECGMTSGLGRHFTVDRDTTQHVKVERIRLGIVTRTVVTFVGADGESLAPSFVPWRSVALRADLVNKRWPVKDVVLGPLGRRSKNGPAGFGT